MKIHQHNDGPMTKVAAMLIYGKNMLEFFPGTTGPILMKHQRPLPFIICASYDLKVCRCRQLIECMKVCEY